MSEERAVWFRRGDGVLVAAKHVDQLDVFLRRGYEPVDTAAAEEEVKSGKQAEANAERRLSDADRREQQLAKERQSKAQARREAARQIVEDGQPDPQLQVTPPKPPEVDPAAVLKALDEAGPETRKHDKD